MGTGAAPALRVAERYVVVYRRAWTTVLANSLVQPLIYLCGMGLGVGQLVDRQSGSVDALGGLSYLAFVGPALLATTVMMSASNDAMWGVMDGFKWSQSFRSMYTAPLSARDIVNGFTVFELARGMLGAGTVGLVLVLFDDTRSWGLIPGVIAAATSGLAITMPLAAFSGRTEQAEVFPAIMRFVIVPMFLFAGAFFPIDQLPGWLRPVAVVTPLWHATELCRGLVVGAIGPGRAALHLVVLAIYAIVGWLWCVRVFTRRLAT